MKIVVVFKWSKNPQDARVGKDGAIDWRGVKMDANDDDPAVMEIAGAIVEDGEIIGLTLGDGDTAWAAARGAAKTMVVADAQTETNSSVTGEILAAAVRRVEGVDAVVIGDSNWDYGVVSALIGQLGWPAVAGVVSATMDDGVLKVTQKIGSTLHVFEAQGPVVLAVTASRSEKKVPGMKEVLMARKKPVEQVKLADLSLDPAGAVSSKGTRLPDTPPAEIIDGSDPVVACDQLIAALRADGVL